MYNTRIRMRICASARVKDGNSDLGFTSLLTSTKRIVIKTITNIAITNIANIMSVSL